MSEEETETTEEAAPVEEAPEAAAEEAPAAEEAAAPVEEAEPDPLDDLPWKERRRVLKSRESGEAGPERSPEQRQQRQREGHSTFRILDEQIDNDDQTGHSQNEDFRAGKAQIWRYKLHFGKRHGEYPL